MKKAKSFDAVKIMREIRDRMSQDMKGMTPPEQIDYIRKVAGLPKEGEKERRENAEAVK